MNYVIIGAGGTGGSLCGYLASSGKDVSIIARGEHLKAIRAQGGLFLKDEDKKGSFLAKCSAYSAEEYQEKADVVFLCVKGYSLGDMPALLEKICHTKTIVIPVLNIVGTGGRLAKELPNLTILDGCIYVSAYISKYGEVTKNAPLLRVVYGERQGQKNRDALLAIEADLIESGATVVVSDDIGKDCFRKYLFLSPFAAAGTYFGATSGELSLAGEGNDLFLALHQELFQIATAMGIVYEEDMQAQALSILHGMSKDGTSSMHKDYAKGKDSELDGLVLEVLRLGKTYGVPTPKYQMVAEKLSRA